MLNAHRDADNDTILALIMPDLFPSESSPEEDHDSNVFGVKEDNEADTEDALSDAGSDGLFMS